MKTGKNRRKPCRRTIDYKHIVILIAAVCTTPAVGYAGGTGSIARTQFTTTVVNDGPELSVSCTSGTASSLFDGKLGSPHDHTHLPPSCTITAGATTAAIILGCDATRADDCLIKPDEAGESGGPTYTATYPREALGTVILQTNLGEFATLTGTTAGLMLAMTTPLESQENIRLNFKVEPGTTDGTLQPGTYTYNVAVASMAN